ncbi:MAG TPA: DUF1015 domain-containing protein [bacterium]|nr:DUF1015 domain-containing protein [bacterium]
MAKIIPFRAWRYSKRTPSQMARVVAPPYDVITNQQKKVLRAADPANVIRLIIGNPSHAVHGPKDYQGAKKSFGAWKKKGTLVRDQEPSVYIYRQTFKIDGKVYHRTGFIALSRLTPFGNKKGGILAHEHTLSGPKADRLKLMKATHANFSCIFSLYPDQKGVGKMLAAAAKAQATYSVEFPKGIHNQVWKVSDPKWIGTLQKKIGSATLFIADGHHRYETALAFQSHCAQWSKGPLGSRPFDYVQMMFVAMEDPGLVILPTHRMLPQRHISSPSLLLSRLSSLGEIHEYKKPLAGSAPWYWLASLGKKRPTLGLSFDGKKLYALQFSKAVAKSPLLKDVSDAQKKLDVTLLHRLILEPFFGITKEKVEHEISFTSKAEEAVSRLRKGEFAATFFLNPTRIEQLREVALKQERMPQKSTYFYPKLVTGLTFNELDSF